MPHDGAYFVHNGPLGSKSVDRRRRGVAGLKKDLAPPANSPRVETVTSSSMATPPTDFDQSSLAMDRAPTDNRHARQTYREVLDPPRKGDVTARRCAPVAAG